MLAGLQAGSPGKGRPGGVARDADRQGIRLADPLRHVEGIVDDVNPTTVEDYIHDVDLVIDALDNFETRFVVNDACHKLSKTWIYSAARR